MLFVVLAEQVFKRIERLYVFDVFRTCSGSLTATANVRTRTNEIYTRLVQVEEQSLKPGFPDAIWHNATGNYL